MRSSSSYTPGVDEHARGRVPAPGRRGTRTVTVGLAVLGLAVLGLAGVGPAIDRARPVAAPDQQWPAGLAEAAHAAIEADAYRFAPGAGGDWEAATPAHGLRSRFAPDGPVVTPSAGSWQLRLRLARMGRPGSLEPVADAEVVGSDDGVEYRRGPSLTEWYRNDPRGLEQGFTLAEPPAGAGPVTFELDGEGLALALSPDGAEVMGTDPDGTAVLRYGKLEVIDATGRLVPSTLGVEAGAVHLRVDDTAAAYPLLVDPLIEVTLSTQVGKVVPDGAAQDVRGPHFGWSVAVSGSGQTAVVGAPFADNSATDVDAGAAYVFVNSGGTWTRQAKLTAPDTDAGIDGFGVSVAIYGTLTLVVGAFLDNSGAGSAYVFVRSGTSWTQQAKLTNPFADSGALFGHSVAIHGDNVVVGAPAQDVGPRTDAGIAYVFRRSGAGWAAKQHFFARDPSAGDQFGDSVAIDGDTVVVGSPGDDSATGSAYMFVNSTSGFLLEAKLTASDPAPGDRFGESVAITGGAATSGSTVVVGAPNDDLAPGLPGLLGTDRSDAGSASVFVRSGRLVPVGGQDRNWIRQAKLTASDAAAGDRFGLSVAVSGRVALVGSPGADSFALLAPQTGAAYVYLRNNSTWAEQQKLTASDANAGDQFGQSVSLWGANTLVGATWDDTDAGSAYFFQTVINVRLL